MEDNTKFVRYDNWCSKCVRSDVSESPKTAEESKAYDICNQCLTDGARLDGSEKPTKFEEK